MVFNMIAKRTWVTLMTAGLILAFVLSVFPGTSHAAMISMTTHNEELGKVLKELSDSSGWVINIGSDEELPVSVDFKNKTLDEAITSILQNAGIVSHSIVKYSKQKEIVIHVFDKSMTDAQATGNRVVPGTSGQGEATEQGITLREVLLSQMGKPETDPLDDVVIPPDEEHPNGMTLREFREAEKNRPEVSLDDVVIPPDEEHPNGMTLREVQEAEKNRPAISLDDVVIPPDEEHPNGITLREVKEAERARASAGKDLDEIVIPGVDENDPGITLREVLAAKKKRMGESLTWTRS